MTDRSSTIDLSKPGYSGIIVMRPYEGYHRGCLLMNISETEARIKFMKGFWLASFFVDLNNSIVAEYVRWESADHLATAFRQPEFAEHLPIAEMMSPHPALVFGQPDAVLNSTGAARFDFKSDTYSLSIVQCDPVMIGKVKAALISWCRGLIGKGVDFITTHSDAEKGQIGLLMGGSLPEMPAPDPVSLGAEGVEHLSKLKLYGHVLPENDRALEFHYSMLPA